MSELNAGEFLAAIAADRKASLRKIMLPELGAGRFVYIAPLDLFGREWYGARQEQFRAMTDPLAQADAKARFPAEVLVRQLVDEHGVRKHDDAEVKNLCTVSPKIAAKLFKAIQDASDLLPDAVDDAEKNSAAAPSSGSSSPSPSASE